MLTDGRSSTLLEATIRFFGMVTVVESHPHIPASSEQEVIHFQLRMSEFEMERFFRVAPDIPTGSPPTKPLPSEGVAVSPARVPHD